MRAEQVDPRDQTSEIDDPTYRVYFWEGDGSSEEWEISETDVDGVLAWIPTRSDGRSHSLWAVVRSPGDVRLVRLQGIDAGTGLEVWPNWARQTYL
jgi:hypothetical protein